MFFLQSYFGVELQPDVEASAAISYAGTVSHWRGQEGTVEKMNGAFFRLV
jgi:trimethylamine:corrinoid methyltransferase-like protein